MNSLSGYTFHQTWTADKDLSLPAMLHLDAGRVYHLSGANGSGKTTLMQLMAGTLSNSKVLHSNTNNKTLNNNIFFLPHNAGFRRSWTGWDNLDYWCSLHNLKVKDHIINISKHIDIYKLNNLMDIPLAQLSAGQQQRQALLRLALVSDRKLWLLDEPETNLDDDATQMLGQVVADHAKSGGTVVWASHGILPVPTPDKITL